MLYLATLFTFLSHSVTYFLRANAVNDDIIHIKQNILRQSESWMIWKWY